MEKSSFTLSELSSKIGSVLRFIFSGLVFIISFLIATPFFLLSVFFNWIKMSLGFALFWFIGDLIYTSIIINSQNFQPFTNTSILMILGLGLIASIFVTVANIKE